MVPGFVALSRFVIANGMTAEVKAAFRNHPHESHLHDDSHRGIPKGLKLVPGETQMSRFEHVCS